MAADFDLNKGIAVRKLLWLLFTALPVIAHAGPSTPDWTKIIAVYPGSWKVESDSPGDQDSGPMHVSITITRDCHTKAKVFTCVESVDGRLVGYTEFSRDTDGSYRVHSQDTQGDDIDGSVKFGDDGSVVISNGGEIPGATPDAPKTPFQGRYTYRPRSPDKLDFENESLDEATSSWTIDAQGTQTRVVPVAVVTVSPALDAIVAGFGGSWTAVEQKPGAVAQGTTTRFDRDCWRDGDTLKCAIQANDRPVAEFIFTCDKTSGVCRQQIVNSTGNADGFDISIKGDTWAYEGDSHDSDGNATHLRLTKVFKTPDSTETKREYRNEAGQWMTYSTVTETRKPAGG